MEYITGVFIFILGQAVNIYNAISSITSNEIFLTILISNSLYFSIATVLISCFLYHHLIDKESSKKTPNKKHHKYKNNKKDDLYIIIWQLLNQLLTIINEICLKYKHLNIYFENNINQLQAYISRPLPDFTAKRNWLLRPVAHCSWGSL